MSREIGLYEIRFAVDGRMMDQRNLPPGVAYNYSCVCPQIRQCAIVVSAYHAEDALVDLEMRLRSQGWRREQVCLQSITPTSNGQACPPIGELPYYFRRDE